MRIESLNSTDRDALLALWNRSAEFDAITPALFAEKLWNDSAFEPNLASCAITDEGIAGFAVGVIRERQKQPMGFIKLLAVDPRHQRQGIGTALLLELESRLAARGLHAIRVCESAPNYLTPGVDERYTAAARFFEKHGYQMVAKSCNQSADLSAQEFNTSSQEAELKRCGIEIRRADLGDERAVMDLLREHWAAWIPEVNVAFRNSPVSVHVATAGGKVIGFAAHDSNNLGTGWFGPMGTAPEARGKGAGVVLLHRCLRDLKEQGHRTAIIPWVGPVEFYEKHCGAKLARTFLRFEKKLE